MNTSDMDVDPMQEWSSFVNLFFFNQAFPAVRRAASRTLKQDDIADLLNLGTAEKSKYLHAAISHQDTKLPLWRHLVSAQSTNLWLGGITTFINAAGMMSIPLLVGAFVQAVKDKSEDGWRIALGIVILKVIMSFADQLSQHVGWRLGQRIRAAIIGSVYRAALVLTGSPASASQDGTVQESSLDGTSSRLLNLVSNDAQKLYEIAPLIHQLWAAPLMIIVACALLIWLLGAAALAGIAMLFVLGPLNVFVLGKFSQLRKAHMPLTDSRVAQLSEAIRSMRMIKFFSWENPLYKALFGIRRQELRFVRRELDLFAANISLMITFPVWATTTGLAIYALDNNLTSADAFSALLFFTILRFPLNQLGMVAAAVVQGKVALSRLQSVMREQQLELDQRAQCAAASAAAAAHTQGHQQTEDAPGQVASRDTSTAGHPREPNAMHSVGAMQLQTAAYSALITRHAGQYCRWVPRGTGEVPVGAGGSKPGATEVTAKDAGSDADTVPEATAQDVACVVQEAQAAAALQAGGDVAVRVAECSFRWGHGSSHEAAADAAGSAFRLAGVQLDLQAGQLLAVVGPVGSGKSTLAAGLLGECVVQRSGGKGGGAGVEVRGGVAYVPQNAWIMNASVRDNILFGRAMVPAAYRCTLWAAALLDDLAIMPGGDRTMIGENGVTISGGQQQRVSLARAVYACLVSGDSELEPRATVLIADDPLSALDAHTGATVFHRVFSHNGILRHTTRVLMTHAVQYVVDASQLLALRGGRVVWQGPFSEMGEHVHSAAQRDGITSQEADDLQWLQAAVLSPLADEGHLGGGGNGLNAAPSGDEATTVSVDELVGKAPVESGVPAECLCVALGDKGDALMTNEEQASGTLSGAVIAAWIKAAGGGWVVVALLMFLVLERAAYVAVDWWLAVWTQAADGVGQTPVEGLPELTSSSRKNFYVPGYVVLTAVMTVLVFMRCFSWAVAGARAADSLADGMLRRILRAPVSFFDTTPAGRIISRCSHDVETIDFLLVRNLMAASASVGWLVSGFVVMISFSPWSAVVLLPVLGFFFYMQSIVRNALRDFQRLDNITRSPITAHLSETLAGCTCIRAYGPAAVQRFIQQADALTDVNSAAIVGLKNVNRYLGIRVDLLACAIIAAVTFVSYFTRDSMPEGLAGLVVVYSFNVTVSLTYFIQFGVDMESKLVSVERIKHYTDTIAPEASLFKALTPQAAALQSATHSDAQHSDARMVAAAKQLVAELSMKPPARPEGVQLAVQGGAHSDAAGAVLHVPPASWPSAGHLVFKDVCLRYRAGLPLALRNMSFELPPGSHVGICGRTGAGKSSISVALFRLVELAGGSIEIDGVALDKIGLSFLRGQAHGICIVPQAPTLMAATVRENLDRFQQHSDEEVLEALAAVQMLHKCYSVARSAEADLGKGGSDADAQALGTASAEEVEIQMVPTAIQPAAAPDPTGALTPEQQALALGCPVSEGGGNFSVGEAQLLCLARALLRKPKVLVMDEASASVDAQTENTLVQTVRERFRGTTVLTIAHRLFTLVHSDKILLLHEGSVLELDSPAALLANPDSKFSSLVDAMGPDASAAFRAAVSAHETA